MAAGEIHLNDIGLSLRGTIRDQDGAVVDLSGATVMNFKLEKPDGSSVTKAATHVNDGTDGLIEYMVESGVLDLVGRWRVQAYVEVGNQKLNSDTKCIRIYGNI